MDHLVIAMYIDRQRTQVVDRAVALTLGSSGWAARLELGDGERLALDYDVNLAAVAKAIRHRSPAMLSEHLRRCHARGAGQAYSRRQLREALGYKWSAISALLPQEALPTIAGYLELAMSSLDDETDRCASPARRGAI